MLNYFSKTIEKLLAEFVYGGHLLSVGSSSVIISTALLQNLQINISLVLIPYLSTQLVYSYNHFKEVNFDISSNPERVSHINSKSNFIKISLLIYATVLLAILIFTNLPTILFVLAIVIGGILYTDYFKVKVAQFVTGSKNFYSAFFWALQIFLVPLFYRSEFTRLYIFFFIVLFLTAFINSTFFDIKDIQSDSERNIKTFPVIWGVNKTIHFLVILKLITLIPVLIGIYTEVFPKSAIVFIFFVMYGLYYLTRALYLKGKKLRKLSYIIADGEYILWSIFLLIIGNLIK